MAISPHVTSALPRHKRLAFAFIPELAVWIRASTGNPWVNGWGTRASVG